MRLITKTLPIIKAYFKNTSIITSIDVINICNLHCKHCYWWQQKRAKALTLEEWQPIWESLRKRGIVFCAWVGGEPLLPDAKPIVEEGKKYFASNIIFTNGTFPLPNWKEVTFGISIDGTQEIHDEIRGKGAYHKTRTNILNASPGLKIYIDCTLHKLNYSVIEDIIKDWKNTPAKGIIFQFASAIKENDPLCLSPEERDRVLDNLIRLRKKYGSFLAWDTPYVLNLMKSINFREIVTNCPIAITDPRGVISLDSLGKRKKPCILGELDCLKCGCIIPFVMTAYYKRDLLTSLELFKATAL